MHSGSFGLSFLPGQTVIHTPQPVQSNGEIANVYLCSLNPTAGKKCEPSGALASSSGVTKNGRIAACGHANAHWLHWIQWVGSQWGID